MRSTLGGLVCRAPQRRERLVRIHAGILGASLFLGLALTGADAGAQCILVRERGGPEYAPHFVLHFGDADGVPRDIRCSTSLDKEKPTFDVPIYAYNLWEGADAFDLAVRTPLPPVAFDPGAGIDGFEMDVHTEASARRQPALDRIARSVAGLSRQSALRLRRLPESCQLLLSDNRGRAGRRRRRGSWRAAIADGGGAHVAQTRLVRPHRVASKRRPRPRGRARRRRRTHESSWRERLWQLHAPAHRTDGRTSDRGTASCSLSYPRQRRISAAVRLASRAVDHRWSVTRGPLGDLMAPPIECGSLASVSVQIPSTSHLRLGSSERLYR